VALGAETEVGAGDDCYVSVGGLLYFYFCFSFAIAIAIDEKEHADGMVLLGRLLILNIPPSSGLSASPVIGSRLVNRV
jgi:hypothetical protein